MSKSKKELIKYRLQRAFETHDDALLLAQSKKWNSAMNRLYYTGFYAVSALVLYENQTAYSHNGVKIFFSEKFIKTEDLSFQMESYFLNFILSVRKVIMTICSTLMKKQFLHI